MDLYSEALSALERSDEVINTEHKHLQYRQTEAARHVAVAQVYATLWVGNLLAMVIDGERSITVEPRQRGSF